uniref:Uncharacterized protein n=1 Tax=Mastacembelus armatus TaxID=205130 RepID=A0A7N8XIR0_9TELE
MGRISARVNKLTKLKQVINRLKDLRCKIIFLEEIHLTVSEVKKIQHRWPGQVIHHLFLTLSSLHGLNVIGGDFNCTLNSLLDCSTKSDPHKAQSRKLLIQYMADLNLTEVWRKLQ